MDLFSIKKCVNYYNHSIELLRKATTFEKKNISIASDIYIPRKIGNMLNKLL